MQNANGWQLVTYPILHMMLSTLLPLGWNISLDGPAEHLQSLELADFLSIEMARGSVVDELVAEHVGVCAVISVEGLSFSQALRRDHTRWERCAVHPSFSRLRDIGNRLHNGTLDQVFFPINIDDVHWTLFLIDVHLYGDSLDWSWPTRCP
jgi:hypothetical protein